MVGPVDGRLCIEGVSPSADAALDSLPRFHGSLSHSLASHLCGPCAEGRTPLHLAALGGHAEVVTFLLQVRQPCCSRLRFMAVVGRTSWLLLDKPWAAAASRRRLAAPAQLPVARGTCSRVLASIHPMQPMPPSSCHFCPGTRLPSECCRRAPGRRRTTQRTTRRCTWLPSKTSQVDQPVAHALLSSRSSQPRVITTTSSSLSLFVCPFHLQARPLFGDGGAAAPRRQGRLQEQTGGGVELGVQQRAVGPWLERPGNAAAWHAPSCDAQPLWHQCAPQSRCLTFGLAVVAGPDGHGLRPSGRPCGSCQAAAGVGAARIKACLLFCKPALQLRKFDF